jgi:hypothetical protein
LPRHGWRCLLRSGGIFGGGLPGAGAEDQTLRQ